MSGKISGGGPSQSLDFELNIASIIDCFTVLIAFMLASASFLSIGILDAGVAAAGATATDATPPPVNLTIELKQDHSIQVKLGGKATQNLKVSAKNGTFDLESMGSQVHAIKAQWTTLNAATLIADNSIEYKEVIQTMESLRKELPVVLLGGF